MIQTTWEQHYLKHWIMVIVTHTYYEFIPQILMSQDLWLENFKGFFSLFFSFFCSLLAKFDTWSDAYSHSLLDSFLLILP